jgi:transposase
MTNGRVEIITSVERRRRWSAAEKERLVAATLEPDASVTAIAREAGIQPGQLYGWRRQLRARPRGGFAPVQVTADPALPAPAGVGTIVIELATGARMRITGAVDEATLAAAIATLARDGRRR